MNEKKQKQNKKHSLSKFFNKFITFNLITTIGLTMLFLSVANRALFEQKEIISNIVASSLTLLIGIVISIILIVLFHRKSEIPHYKELSKWCLCLCFVPLFGAIITLIWKNKEKHFLQNKNKIKQKPFIPNSISIIFCGSILTIIIIWFFYLSGLLKKDQNTIIPGVLDIFLNPLKGFEQVAPIAILLFMLGGTISLVNETKAFEAGISCLLRKLKNKEIILIPILMLIFGICGSTYGACEETLPLYLIVIPFFYAAGYDCMTGFLVVFMGAGVGVMASTVNPYTIGISVSAINKYIDESNPTISTTTGIVWRLVTFLVLISIAIAVTMLYAKKVKNNPKKSYVYLSRDEFNKKYSFGQTTIPTLTKKQIWTLIVFALAFVFMIICYIDWQTLTGFNGFQYLHDEIGKIFPFLTSVSQIGKWETIDASMLFFIASIIIGAINWKGSSHWFTTFYSGCKDFISVVFVIAVARGITITLSNSGFSTIITSAFSNILKLSSSVMIVIIVFVMISLLSLFIPSTSGLSATTMPIIGGAVFNINKNLLSGTVTTFSAAAGWANLFIPTGMVIPFLETSKMTMLDFTKTTWKHLLILFIAGIGMLSIGTFLPSGMF